MARRGTGGRRVTVHRSSHGWRREQPAPLRRTSGTAAGHRRFTPLVYELYHQSALLPSNPPETVSGRRVYLCVEGGSVCMCQCVCVCVCVWKQAVEAGRNPPPGAAVLNRARRRRCAVRPAQRHVRSGPQPPFGRSSLAHPEPGPACVRGNQGRLSCGTVQTSPAASPSRHRLRG